MSQTPESLARAFAARSVLVTGATGLIGQRLVELLLAAGAQVHVLSRRAPGDELLPDQSVVWHQGALQDQRMLVEICKQVDTVFHLASYAPAANDQSPEDNPAHWPVTVEGTRELLMAAARTGVKSFVFSSSTRAIDGGDSLYCRAKQAAEHLVMDAAVNSMHTCILRFAPVYGFLHKGSIAQMLAAVKRGRFPPIPDFSDQRSLLHCDDAVQAMLLGALRPQAHGRAYTVTDLCSYSSRQIYELICNALGRPIPSWRVPLWVLKAAALGGDLIQRLLGKPAPISSEKLRRLSTSAWFDGSDIQQELDYQPNYTLMSWLAELK